MAETKQETFIVRLEPINEHISTKDLERKLRIMMAGCGIKTVSAQPVKAGEGDKISGG